MVYLALLRGINVGGKNRVEMGRLRAVFESVGLEGVRTYINTGNVVFTARKRSPAKLAAVLQEAIAGEFGLRLEVLIRDAQQMARLIDALPDGWINDSTMKCDVLFLWEGVDDPATLELVTAREGIDDVAYVPGAIIWRVDRSQVTRSGLTRIVGTDLYKQVTVRNCNTVRKLEALMQSAAR